MDEIKRIGLFDDDQEQEQDIDFEADVELRDKEECIHGSTEFSDLFNQNRNIYLKWMMKRVQSLDMRYEKRYIENLKLIEEQERADKLAKEALKSEAVDIGDDDDGPLVSLGDISDQLLEPQLLLGVPPR
ncbi:hypothetical protein V2J09_016461 [Rumex salicifolius]